MPGTSLDFRTGWLGVGLLALALEAVIGLVWVLWLAWGYVLLLDVVQRRPARRPDA